MKIGELFAGYGGLGCGVQSVLGGEIAWHSEIEPAACRILAHHWPDVPNLGDITAVDWSQVEPVDVLTGGFPCTDVSAAGKREGLNPNTRSGLWSEMARAIDALRPSLVVIENVRGLLSAKAEHPAHGDFFHPMRGGMEPCPWCVGDDDGPALRALGAVLGDLADVGFDAQWTGLRAADVGAPHGRFRVFVVAWPAADAFGGGRIGRPHDPVGLQVVGTTAPGGGAGSSAWGPHGPAVAPCGDDPRKCGGCGWCQDDDAAADADGWRREGIGIEEPAGLEGARWGEPDRRGPVWGQFEPAVRRWERLTRPAPAPTEAGKTGAPRLSPAFVEWLMGLPVGHVTGVPGVSRNEQLKALGNGVVPQQAAEALRRLLHGVHVAPVEVGGLLPTPTASDGKRTTVSRNAAANHSATTLGLEVARLKDGAA